jgi:hypothetical protein
MFVRLFALSLALGFSASSPAWAFGEEQKAPQAADGDKNEKICENVTMIGSRLAKKRVCGTRAEWEDRKLQDRQAVEKAQTSPCVLQSTGAKGRPSC